MLDWRWIQTATSFHLYPCTVLHGLLWSAPVDHDTVKPNQETPLSLGTPGLASSSLLPPWSSLSIRQYTTPLLFSFPCSQSTTLSNHQATIKKNSQPPWLTPTSSSSFRLASCRRACSIVVLARTCFPPSVVDVVMTAGVSRRMLGAVASSSHGGATHWVVPHATPKLGYTGVPTSAASYSPAR